MVNVGLCFIYLGLLFFYNVVIEIGKDNLVIERFVKKFILD